MRLWISETFLTSTRVPPPPDLLVPDVQRDNSCYTPRFSKRSQQIPTPPCARLRKCLVMSEESREPFMLAKREGFLYRSSLCVKAAVDDVHLELPGFLLFCETCHFDIITTHVTRRGLWLNTCRDVKTTRLGLNPPNVRGERRGGSSILRSRNGRNPEDAVPLTVSLTYSS